MTAHHNHFTPLVPPFSNTDVSPFFLTTLNHKNWTQLFFGIQPTIRNTVYISQSFPHSFLTDLHFQIRKEELVLHPKANTQQKPLFHPLWSGKINNISIYWYIVNRLRF